MAEQGEEEHAKKKTKTVPPLHQLIAANNVQNPLFDFLIPGQRCFSAATFASEFRNLLKSSQSLGFKETTVIQVGEYRLPPLHWSATLGCGTAVQELLKMGYNPLLKVRETGHTALHSAALFGPMGRWHVNDTSRVFARIVPMLLDALFIQDNNLATPFHLVAFGISGTNRARLYEIMLHVFFTQLKGRPEKASDVLNIQDQQGNTMMHYLAECSSLSEKILLDLWEFDISFEIKNKEGHTAYDISVKHNNKPIIELFGPDATATPSTLTNSSSKQPKTRKRRHFDLHNFKEDKETRRRRKPNRYDPTFHDEVPKFLQLDVQKVKKKKKKMESQSETGNLSDSDTDVEKSRESNSEEAGGNRSRTSVESAIVSSSLSVNLSKNLYVDGEKFELSSQPSAAGNSSHAGKSHQELLPLLESLVASGLWKQLTDLATRMKRELEQERLECNRRLEVTASSIVKVKDNLRRCNSEMERLHKEISSLHRTEIQLSEHERITADQLNDIDNKISKLDSFVKQATTTGTNKQ